MYAFALANNTANVIAENSGDASLAIATWVLAFSTIGLAIATLIIGQKHKMSLESAAESQKAASKSQEMAYKLSGMVEIMKVFGSDKDMAAREKVYEGYLQFKAGNTNVFQTSPYREAAQTVRTNLNLVGTLFNHGLIDAHDAFLETYWATIRKYWNILEPDIMNERKLRKNNQHFANFEKLNHKAEEYRKKHHPDTPAEPF